MTRQFILSALLGSMVCAATAQPYSSTQHLGTVRTEPYKTTGTVLEEWEDRGALTDEAEERRQASTVVSVKGEESVDEPSEETED